MLLSVLSGLQSEDPHKNLHPTIAAAVRRLEEQFGKTFGLRAFPATKFRIGYKQSYLNHENVVMVYTQRYDKDTDRWLDFAKGTESEVREQAVPLRIT